MGEPAVGTETPVRCLLCGRSGAERIATHPEFAGTAIFSCRECTFAFGAPAPSDDELADYYQKTYPLRRTWSTQPEYLTLMQRRAVAQVQFFAAELRRSVTIAMTQSFGLVGPGGGPTSTTVMCAVAKRLSASIC